MTLCDQNHQCRRQNTYGFLYEVTSIVCLALYNMTGLLCNIGYPFETHLKPKSCEISFAQNLWIHSF